MQSTKSTASWTHPPKQLDLQPHQVDVWRIFLDLQPVSSPKGATVKGMESILSADEFQRAARFHSATNRDRYIAAHGCLRDILARYLRLAPGQLMFSINQYGKPALEGHDLAFNLSHSGDFALVAVTRGRKIGVDVERIRSDMEHESVASRFFSTNEVSELMTLPSSQRVNGFFHCWTRKEAFIKAQGLGLSLPLDSFDVSLTPNEPAVLRAVRLDALEAMRWMLLSLEVDAHYAAAMIVEGRDLEVRFWDWGTRE